MVIAILFKLPFYLTDLVRLIMFFILKFIGLLAKWL